MIFLMQNGDEFLDFREQKSNTVETVSKNKRSCKDDEPFITVMRKKNLEILFAQSQPEKEKPDDSEINVASKK